MGNVIRRAFFLDRDGVINVDHGYVNSPENFEFISGVFEACRLIVKQGYKIVVVTNQAGIGRGFYSEEQFHKLTKWMIEEFSQHGVEISDVQFCPHHESAGLGQYKLECFYRKPNPGMILKSAEKLNINLAESVLVGDKKSDIDAARNAGIGTKFMVGSHFSEVEDFYSSENLYEAVNRYFSFSSSDLI